MDNHSKGKWAETQPGYFHWETEEPLSFFDLSFHAIAIQTNGSGLQEAAHEENDAEFFALCVAGGTSSGFTEAKIDDKPVVVFLVPFDR